MMATDKDLLDKADALLRRHALGAGAETGTYPVLTDLVVPPELPAGDEPAEPKSDEAPPAPRAEDTGLRDEIVARVLQELRARLGVELEREVARTLAPQLRAAVAESLAGLEQRLSGIVTEAVIRALEERPLK